MAEITTQEEALDLIKQNRKALQFVPKNLKSAGLCLEAVKQNRHAIEDVPVKLQRKIKDELGL